MTASSNTMKFRVDCIPQPYIFLLNQAKQFIIFKNCVGFVIFSLNSLLSLCKLRYKN